MNLKLSPLQSLKLLFGFQLLALLALVIAIAFFQPSLAHTTASIQLASNKLPSIHQQLMNEQDPAKLRNAALFLVDGSVEQTGLVQEMLMTPTKLLIAHCLTLLVFTIWLGISTHQLGLTAQKVAETPSA